MSLLEEETLYLTNYKSTHELDISKQCDGNGTGEFGKIENGFDKSEDHNLEEQDSLKVEEKSVVSKKPRQKVECTKCKKLLLKSQLKRHMRANHQYKRTFSCNLYSCNRGFTSKKKLEHHVLYDHEQNIIVPEDKICPYCKVSQCYNVQCVVLVYAFCRLSIFV